MALSPEIQQQVDDGEEVGGKDQHIQGIDEAGLGGELDGYGAEQQRGKEDEPQDDEPQEIFIVCHRTRRPIL